MISVSKQAHNKSQPKEGASHKNCLLVNDDKWRVFNTMYCAREKSMHISSLSSVGASIKETAGIKNMGGG